MVFALSTPPDITEDLPTDITRRIQSAAALVEKGEDFDLAIGGLPFFVASTDQNPHTRETADFRKQQFDTSREPGEQSLDQWWTRDQASWHRGAGINFYEPGSDEGTVSRFHASAGVDVWTPGQVTLLKAMGLTVSVGPAAVCYATTGMTGATSCVFTNENGVVHRRTAATDASYTGATALSPVAQAGAKILVGTSTKIVAADASGSTFADLWTNFAAAPTPYWAKSRIIAAAGNKLYDLTLTGGDVTSSTPLSTHPDSAWTWTSVTEAPSAILAAGKSNGIGAIYRFALEDAGSGTVPQLGQAYQVAEFPPGEEVLAIRVYLGQYIAIGTSKGLRIGILDADANMQYGPVIYTGRVAALAARDSFVYAAAENSIDGASGVVRVNLSEAVDDSGLRFAYATDAQTHTTGQVNSVAFLGNTDRVVVALQDSGVWLQSDTLYEPEGYVTSGGIRYATTEPKLFRRAKVRCKASEGTVTLFTVDAAGNEAHIFDLGQTINTNEDIGLALPVGAQPYLSIKLKLSPSSNQLETPTLEGFQTKALPQVKRQRIYTYPLMLMDREKNRNGIEIGYDGLAADRLAALEAIEDLQAIVQVQDFRSGESFTAQVEKLSFSGTTPSSRAGANFGGLLTVALRRL